MAKGSSVFAASTLIEEAAGEHRRSVARPRRGRPPGTRDADQAAPVGAADPGRRFDDLANLVYDPAFPRFGWSRVRGNKGARTAGVDGVAPRSVVFTNTSSPGTTPSCPTAPPKPSTT
jgi:hypothetical protein